MAVPGSGGLAARPSHLLASPTRTGAWPVSSGYHNVHTTFPWLAASPSRSHDAMDELHQIWSSTHLASSPPQHSHMGARMWTLPAH